MRNTLNRTLLSLGALAVAISSMAGVIVLEGHYQGKNLYVQNPFSEAGVGFCVYEVTVNEQITTDEVNSSAFEIDLTAFQMEQGAQLVVKIKHKDGCVPLVLNPEVLKPKSTYEVSSIAVGADGTLAWATSNETGELPFVIEQKRWNKWVKVGEVMGVGTPGEHSYQFKVTPHSGQNTFRVKQQDFSKRPRYSEAASYTATSVSAVDFSPKKPNREIKFTSKTLYEIYDQYGNIVKRGYGDRIEVNNMKKDLYYLNYDNKMGETFIKR